MKPSGSCARKASSRFPPSPSSEYFSKHRESQDQAAGEAALLDYKISEFKKQVAAGVAFAVGSDVGPFPHGTQARELELMVQYGMKPLAVLQADMINGAKLLGWEGQIGQLKPGYFADIIAVQGNPLDNISRRRTRNLCDEERDRGPAVIGVSARVETFPRSQSRDLGHLAPGII